MVEHRAIVRDSISAILEQIFQFPTEDSFAMGPIHARVLLIVPGHRERITYIEWTWGL